MNAVNSSGGGNLCIFLLFPINFLNRPPPQKK